MNKNILNTGIQNFINKNLNTDITSVLLKGTNFNKVSTKEIVAQIEAKKKCKNKLPTWFSTPNIYYPNKLSIEQTSSEVSANYKASIIGGKSIIDLTGGFGIDSYSFSKKFKQVTHCEINKNLSEITDYNYNLLGVNNVTTIPEDGMIVLKKLKSNFDWVYIDPSRRNDSKEKVFILRDCLPNIPENLQSIFKFTSCILIKTSPLLDISFGLKELRFTKEIHVVAIQNEVKELLWILEKNYEKKVLIKTVNIKNDKKEVFDFYFSDEKQSTSIYSTPLTYLYEPNVAILKSGAFNSISEKLNVKKIHQHAHLYTSNYVIKFPGRTFSVESVMKYNRKKLKAILKNSQGNITVRNFPETVNELRKSLKMYDGGQLYYFFTTTTNNDKIVICCKKL